MKLINRLFIILISCLLSSVALAKDLTVGLKSEPSSIDPHYHNLGPNNAFATHIYGTLVGQMKINNIIQIWPLHGNQSMIPLGNLN